MGVHVEGAENNCPDLIDFTFGPSLWLGLSPKAKLSWRRYPWGG